MGLSSWNIAIVIILVFLIFKAADANAPTKCTDKDPRQVYPYCMFYDGDDSLWCDQSSYKKLPSVKEINSHLALNRDCRSARKLYVNDSCLEGIGEEDLRPYPKISTLYGDKNNIKSLMPKTFKKNMELENIDFCSNKIETVDMHAFNGLRRLHTLLLDNNEIKTLDSDTFSGLHSLRTISVSNNKLTEITVSHYSRLRNLETLRLQGNSICRINNRAFAGMTALKRLHLDDNQLNSITPATFEGMQGLEVLTMSGNGIASWPSEYGAIFINLHTLHLGSNRLSDITLTENSKNATSLRTLSLDNNLFTEIPETLFKTTPGLRHLNLSSNPFGDFPADAFKPLSNLTSLYIKDTKQTKPKVEWFENLVKNADSDSNVDLSENEWVCDCETITYLQYTEGLLKHHKPAVRMLASRLRIVCDSPIQYHNRPLTPELGNQIIAEQKCSNPTFETTTTTTTVSTTTDKVIVPIVKVLQSSKFTPASTAIAEPTKEPVSVGLVVGIIVVLFVVLLALLMIYRYHTRAGNKVRKRHNSQKEKFLSESETPEKQDKCDPSV